MILVIWQAVPENMTLYLFKKEDLTSSDVEGMGGADRCFIGTEDENKDVLWLNQFLMNHQDKRIYDEQDGIDNRQNVKDLEYIIISGYMV